MKHLLAILPFLGLAAVAQDDPFQSLQVGDRLQVTFRTGGSMIGTLTPPPVAGAAAVQKKKPKPVEVKGPATPFTLTFFFKKADASSAPQEAMLEQWMRTHPEGTLTRVSADDKAGQDQVKVHKIAALPAVLFQDPTTGVTQAYLGVQAADRLDAMLSRFRMRADDAKVDFSKEEFLTFDVSLEYPGLNGTLSISRKDIKEVRKLQKLDEATRRRLEEERKKIGEFLAADEAARRESEAKRTEDARMAAEKEEKEAKEAALKADEVKALEAKAAKLKLGEELLKQFPPDKWGEDKIKEIVERTAAQLPVTTEERLFLQSHREWLDAVKAKETEKKEKPPEEGSGEKK